MADIIKIQKGTSKKIKIVIPPENNNKYYNLTGVTGEIKVYLHIPGQDNPAIISKNVNIISAEEGIIEIDLNNNDTNINPAVYNFYLYFTFSSNDIRLLYQGILEITGDDIDRKEEIRQRYGLTFDDYTLQAGIDYARERMIRQAFYKQEKIFSSKDNIIILDNHVADINFDNNIDINDIDIIMFNTKYPFDIIDLKTHVTDLKLSLPNGKSVIKLDDKYPNQQGYKVKVTYYQIVEKYEKINKIIKLLEELYVIEHLFNTLTINKLQKGITTKQINNINITFDKQSIDDFKKQLKVKIYNEIMRVRPINFKSVNISKGY